MSPTYQSQFFIGLTFKSLSQIMANGVLKLSFLK